MNIFSVQKPCASVKQSNSLPKSSASSNGCSDDICPTPSFLAASCHWKRRFDALFLLSPLRARRCVREPRLHVLENRSKLALEKSFLLSSVFAPCWCWDLPACPFYECVYVIRWLTVKSGLPLVETVMTYNNNTNIITTRMVKQHFKVNAAMCLEICNNYLKECLSFYIFMFLLFLMSFCCWLFVWETTSV